MHNTVKVQFCKDTHRHDTDYVVLTAADCGEVVSFLSVLSLMMNTKCGLWSVKTQYESDDLTLCSSFLRHGHPIKGTAIY